MSEQTAKAVADREKASRAARKPSKTTKAEPKTEKKGE